MIDLSDYSCDKCTREFSRHCKHCLHTAEKPPTRFKPKKKTGIQTPEYRCPTMPPVRPPKPPTSGSNAVKPNPNYIPPASVKTSYLYELPCGWCTKWDKKCDKKIGGGDDKPQRGLRAQGNFIEDVIDFTYGKCLGCKYEVGCDKECDTENNFKYFQPKENDK